MKEMIEDTNQDVSTKNLDTKSETEEWHTVVKKKKVKTKISGEKNVNAKFFGGLRGHDNSGGTFKTTISNQMAGFILRCGGSILYKIKAKSGADIVVTDFVQGSNERNLIIYGTQSQIQRAQELLQTEEKVNEKGEETVKTIISTKYCKCILRNGGSFIRKIESDSKTRISKELTKVLHNGE